MSKIRLLAYLIFFSPLSVHGAPVDISSASILISQDIKPVVQQSALRILQEEVSKRSGVALKPVKNWSESKNYSIALALTSTKKFAGKTPPQRNDKTLPEWQPEGFRIFFEKNAETPILWIIGADSRAVIFGIGELLRSASMDKNKFLVDDNLDSASSPAYSLRGHQIGYRNTANSYDSWSV